MGMLDKIKTMLGGGEIPEEVTPLYKDARSEREALILLKEARRRDEARRKRAMQDIEVLDKMEGELLEEGKEEVGETRRLMLARRIKEIRWKIQELNNRIENIYNKRLRIFNEHVQSLETVLELSSEELPDKKTMEEMAIKAKTLLEELDKTKELAEGIAVTAGEKPVPDSEEREILKEFEAKRDAELEKEEIKVEKPRKEKKKEEKRKEEAPKQDPPEIMYED